MLKIAVGFVVLAVGSGLIASLLPNDWWSALLRGAEAGAFISAGVSYVSWLRGK